VAPKKGIAANWPRVAVTNARRDDESVAVMYPPRTFDYGLRFLVGHSEAVRSWGSLEAFKGFAGDDIDRAVFYPEDDAISSSASATSR
jgi:hypothetical protein